METAIDDVLAYTQALARSEASQAVAAESLKCAIFALQDEGAGIREIAKTLGVPVLCIVWVGYFEPSDRIFFRRQQADSAEYDAAHNAAWRHFPSAQKPR